jgi:pyridoxal phosphate enzyme (YggS family)
MDFAGFDDALLLLRERIKAAAARTGRRTEDIRVLPVTKTHGVGAVVRAARADLRVVGENRVQEAAAKRMEYEALRAADPSLPAVTWELIGHLQSNKAKAAVRTFDRIQSVDTIKLARLLAREAGEAGVRLRILIQVNSGRDPAKFGADPEDAPALLEAALSLPSLAVEGLMAIAPLSGDADVARRTFASLRGLRDELAERFAVELPELSMGMSGDLEAAIEEGSTQIRVGTALFGSRG